MYRQTGIGPDDLISLLISDLQRRKFGHGLP